MSVNRKKQQYPSTGEDGRGRDTGKIFENNGSNCPQKKRGEKTRRGDGNYVAKVSVKCGQGVSKMLAKTRRTCLTLQIRTEKAEAEVVGEIKVPFTRHR